MLKKIVSTRVRRILAESLRNIIVLSVILLALGAPAASTDAELKIELALDRSKIELGQRTRLTVTVDGTSGFSEPVVPSIDGLEIVLQGRSQSVQIINTKVKSSKIFSYAIVPYEIGKYTIGPFEIERQGKIYRSDSVQLSVTEPALAEEEPLSSKKVIVEATVDNANPYVGQQITLLFLFAQRADARIRKASYQVPQLPDFWNESMERKREYRKNINGSEYLVTEVAIPLFPVKEGDIDIGRIAFHYEEVLRSQGRRISPFSESPFDHGFFGEDFFNPMRVEQQTVYSRPIKIYSRPLPLNDKPEGFKGGVGSFKLDAKLSDGKVKMGESVTLTIEISGLGNIRDVMDPEIDIEGVKIYSDTPAINVKSYDDDLIGEKTYKLALVPQTAKKIDIPKISVPYFSPENESYEFAASAPMTLEVIPSREETLVMTAPQVIKKESGRIPLTKLDILPIHERLGTIESSRFELLWDRLKPIAYPLPLILYAICFAFVRQRERLRNDIGYRRQRLASKIAQTHINSAVEAMDQKNWEKVFTECSRAVTEFLADKLNVPAGGLTSSDVESTLSSLGLSEEFLTQIVGFLESCDYGRFASSLEYSALASKYIETAQRIIEYLEHEEAIKR